MAQRPACLQLDTEHHREPTGRRLNTASSLVSKVSIPLSLFRSSADISKAVSLALPSSLSATARACFFGSKSVTNFRILTSFPALVWPGLVKLWRYSIGNAYAVLSNPEKRQQYDQYGDRCPTSNVPHHSGHSRPGHYRNFYRDFEADISPEELFNIFFGGRFPTGNVHVYTNQGASYSQFYQPRRRRAQERHEEVVEENQSQLLPVLVLILISVFTQMMATNPPYSLFYKPAMGLVVSRETQHMGVPYYVDKSFQKEYRGAALEELEKSIESDYIEHLQSSCWKEKQQSKQASLSNIISSQIKAIAPSQNFRPLVEYRYVIMGDNLRGYSCDFQSVLKI
ncbi:hypothetical protein GOODEAATRI_016534 [Goodea atripinnis]|uniref:DUF1977 domain-containing protein n=1 Tax=Goodea atripinnis TaxID=208336 RepID=A0ABV0N1Z0_9TELE